MPLVPARFRTIYTVLLPLIYVGLILFGVSSLFIGSKIIDHAFVEWFSPAWALTTLVGAAMALVGLSTLHDRVELVGAFAVSIGLTIYMAAIVINIWDGQTSATLTLFLTLIRLGSTVWRISDLAGEIARKEAAHDL